MRLWVDDERDPPDDSWIWAPSAEKAISYLRLGIMKIRYRIDTISLDHDLGDSGKSGYDVALYMCKDDCFPDTIFIHSLNPVGADNMEHLLRHYAPERVEIIRMPYTFADGADS